MNTVLGRPLWFVTLSVIFLVPILISTKLSAAEPQQVERIRPAGIDGSLVICGGGKLSDALLDRFVALAGGAKAKLVIIPTASESADKEDADTFAMPWKARKAASVVVLHTRSREKADDPKFVEPLREATGVWFGGGDQKKLTEVYRGTKVEKELLAMLQRGGAIGGTSAGAAVLSKVMIAGGEKDAREDQGFDLLPGAIVDQHFLKRNRQDRLFSLVDRHPGLVGYGIDEGTALIVSGRTLAVLGDSTVTVRLAKSTSREARTIELKSGETIDLTELRRAARERTQPLYPPRELAVPEVPKGSLLIIGGGGMPDGGAKKFIELAGGPDALIAVLPTSMPDPIQPGSAGFLERAGAKNVKTLNAREQKDVEDPKNLEILQKAQGVWFGGGRQWRFVDAYEGTKAYDLLHDVLRRGGVIGGSSAGATIQGDYLCRGAPSGPNIMMCEGYERSFGFLPGVAIDQHFAQRKRFPDMTALMTRYPQFLGIGLDEATAILVQGHMADVMGKGEVHFYDYRKTRKEGNPDYESLKDGQRYDLKDRKVVPK